MKTLFTLTITLLFSSSAFSWGRIGHMTIAEMAEKNLSSKAKVEITKLIGKVPLANISNWGDEVRSDSSFDFAKSWHYANMPLDKEYADSVKNSEGDIVVAVLKFEADLKNRKLPLKDRQMALKFLVHLVGDLHQPMHLGQAEDRGGNKVEIEWFGKKTNLHAVWDEEMVEYLKLSYTEYARFLLSRDDSLKKLCLKGDYLEWAKETHQITKMLYAEPNKKLSYEYYYKYGTNVNDQLALAGYRLGEVLNRALK